MVKVQVLFLLFGLISFRTGALSSDDESYDLQGLDLST